MKVFPQTIHCILLANSLRSIYYDLIDLGRVRTIGFCIFTMPAPGYQFKGDCIYIYVCIYYSVTYIYYIYIYIIIYIYIYILLYIIYNNKLYNIIYIYYI